MHSFLQTKAVSLALESKYIRKQELRFTRKAKIARLLYKDRSAAYHERNREGQYVHRVTVVRWEARVTNLARAFLRGKKYHQVERIAYSMPNWRRVADLIQKYGEQDNPRWNLPMMSAFLHWKDEAVRYFHEQQRERLYAESDKETSD